VNTKLRSAAFVSRSASRRRLKELRQRDARHARSWWPGLRGGLAALLLTYLAASSVSAQLVVNDPAVTARNAITATVKEYLLNVQREQHSEP
jgi:hypothetical protein